MKRLSSRILVNILLTALLMISIFLLCACDHSNVNNELNTGTGIGTGTGINSGSETGSGTETGGGSETNPEPDILIRYVVDNNVCGEIIGKTSQLLCAGDNTDKVIAVADENYVFTGWSDLYTGFERQEKDVMRSFEYVAYFQPKEKTFTYDFGELYPVRAQSSVTVNRFSIQAARFEVPQMDDYTFLGWYADKDFKIKVADENGRLMLGYYAFDLDNDILYARWERNGEDKKVTYKVLTVFTDEVHASLQPTYNPNEPYVSVDYKMSTLEQRFFAFISSEVCEWLNALFQYKVIFEFDMYFTTSQIEEDSFESGSNSGLRTYNVFADRIPEVQDLIDGYESVITYLCMNDYDDILHSVGGVATAKFGMCHIEEELKGYIINHEPLQNMKYDEINLPWRLASYLHEFVHTIEQKYYFDQIFEFHEALGYYLNKQDGTSYLDIIALYLTNTAQIGGTYVGIPQSYWTEGV